jgi:UDP-glucose 4-epimerase
VKACVTGGAGFIGSNLVDRLLGDGHEVVVLDDLSTGRVENLAHVKGDVRFVEGDVREAGVVADAVRGCEVVFHQAALASVPRSLETPGEVTAVNVLGTLNVLLAARDTGARRVVFASSSSVYGDAPELPKVESMPVLPRSPYAASKCAAESYLAAFQSSFGLEGVALRYFNVFGPRQRPDSQYAAAIPRFIEAMTDGRAPTIHGDGEQTRDFTYVGDVVDAVVRGATVSDAPDGPYNIGSGGNRTSINRLAAVIAEAVGFGGTPVHDAPRPGDVRDSLADISRARAYLCWEPATSLEEGISQTVEAFSAPSA